MLPQISPSHRRRPRSSKTSYVCKCGAEPAAGPSRNQSRVTSTTSHITQTTLGSWAPEHGSKQTRRGLWASRTPSHIPVLAHQVVTHTRLAGTVLAYISCTDILSLPKPPSLDKMRCLLYPDLTHFLPACAESVCRNSAPRNPTHNLQSSKKSLSGNTQIDITKLTNSVHFNTEP